ncbi:MAG TPA: BolA family protein [Ferrovibrio sp.]|jgi:BolA protein|uniref:BolA family protein n=1 Tax=Ferrovibrio sp. TaxID=1917215 RepID=UPI002ED1612E
MSIADRMRGKLTAALAPSRLELIDDSARHAGHAGTRGLPGGETHFQLVIVSERFRGLNRLQRQRLVHQLVAEEFGAGLHALAITALTPDEDGTGP